MKIRTDKFFEKKYLTTRIDGLILRLKFQDVSCNPKEKVLHQSISNLHAIAELFLVPKTWMKFFITSLNFPYIYVSYCFSTAYAGRGGGVDSSSTAIGFPLIFFSALFLPFLISIRAFYTCVFSLLSRVPACMCLSAHAGLCLSAKNAQIIRVFFADTIGFLPVTKKPPTDLGKSSVGGKLQFKAQAFGNVSLIIRYLLRGRLSTIVQPDIKFYDKKHNNHI